MQLLPILEADAVDDDDFLRTKLLYHKDSGTMFYHMVQSFPAGEEVDPAVAHAAALKLAEYFEGREMLVSTRQQRIT